MASLFVQEDNMTLVDGYWNGNPAKVRRVRGEIDSPEEGAEVEWWHHYTREIVDAVEITQDGNTFYIYDIDNRGWLLVSDQARSINPTISQMPLKNVKYRFVHTLGDESCDNCHGTGVDYYGNACRRLVG